MQKLLVGYQQRYAVVRARSVGLTQTLSAEDQCVQSMPDASPAKWHLAHTTWFFETLLLQPYLPAYRSFDPRFGYLFNSYYESLGARHPRPQRGLLTRPALAQVLAYRVHVDDAMHHLLQTACHLAPDAVRALIPMLELGLQHEQQHQELLLTDCLHLFSCNPLLPAFDAQALPPPTQGNGRFVAFCGGMHDFGCPVQAGPQQVSDIAEADAFSFDNERPRHARYVHPFQMHSRLVTCGEYLAFMQDGGYVRADLWLSDGWRLVQEQGWRAPLYWLAPDDVRRPCAEWQVFGLSGVRGLNPAEPVLNLSFYEAQAYAHWAGARLPTEFEWELAAQSPELAQCDGVGWQWTRSAYEPYPGFVPWAGPAQEYNGKFMVGQQVLRGSSLATPPEHARLTYRNFFAPAARWQFTGIRLARDMP